MKFFRLMTQLPALPDKPEPPPLGLREVWEVVAEEVQGRAAEAARSVLGLFDCKNLEALLSGAPEAFEDRGTFSRQQFEEREGLPEYMTTFLEAYDAGGLSGPYPFDELWRAYFRHLLELGKKVGSNFLVEWATWEVTLRNALVRERAAVLGWDADPRLADQPHAEPNVQDLAVQIRESEDPVAAKKMLDTARLATIDAASGIDPFGLDALLAYLASMVILETWAVPKQADLGQLLQDMG